MLWPFSTGLSVLEMFLVCELWTPSLGHYCLAAVAAELGQQLPQTLQSYPSVAFFEISLEETVS